MTERLSQELARLLAEGDGRSDRPESGEMLRARLARDMLEGVESRSCANTLKIDCALIAALVDGRLSPGERDSVAARLAEDAVARSDIVSAVALLERIEEQPVKVPTGLAARAVQVLAGHAPGPVGPPAIAVVSMPGLAWLRHAPVWSGLAILAAVMIPTVVWMGRDWSGPPSSFDAPHSDAVKRNDAGDTPNPGACGDQDAGAVMTPPQPREQVRRGKKINKTASPPGPDPCPSDLPDADKSGHAPALEQK